MKGDDGYDPNNAEFAAKFHEWHPDDGPAEPKPKPQAEPGPGGVSLDDFVAYMPLHTYIFIPTREMWATPSVNARIPNPAKGLKANAWLDKNRPVEQMTWAPGEPLMIRDKLIAEGGWFPRPDSTVLNLYLPPMITPKPGSVGLWIDHVYRLFPEGGDHVIWWLAHRVQKPHEKINHALVLGGAPGVGKDTILEPVKQAIGPWNFAEVSPKQVLGRFNGFLKSVILRISEARDLGDFDRFAFYDHTKTLTAAPPDVLRVDEKNLREHYVPNLCGVIITTNHKADGIYLPADDRRHFVAWSSAMLNDFAGGHFHKLYGWYANGGIEAVAAYLADLDLSSFDPKAPPPKTGAFWEIVNASRAPEDAELADALDKLGFPEAVTLQMVANAADAEFSPRLLDHKNRRQIPHRMEKCGYTPVHNDVAKDGLWKVSGKRQVVYAKQELSVHARLAAASALAAGGQ